MDNLKINAIDKTKGAFVLIKGIKVPAPYFNEPEFGTFYFIPFNCERGFGQKAWVGSEFDKRHLKAGFCHKTKEAAVLQSAVAKAFDAGLL